MSGLPRDIADKVATRLDQIQEMLGEDTIITFVGRRPLADPTGFGQGDIIMTRDQNLRNPIRALENREQLIEINLADGSIKLT